MMRCVACNNSNIQDLGKIPISVGCFTLENPGSLYSCHECGIMFRHPYITQLQMEQYYKSLGSDLWKYMDRVEFKLVKREIEMAFSSGKVLDVGCFRGDFLVTLSNGFQKYGTELSEPAQSVARSQGITLMGTSIDDLPENYTYSAISLIDVIEHLTAPVESLVKLSNLLDKKGLLVVTTGNTRALPWRILRSEYWYLFPEHVTFYSKRWFEWLCKRSDLEIINYKEFSHFDGSRRERLRQFCKCIVYGISRRVSGNLKQVLNIMPLFSKANEWKSAPITNLMSDHLLVTMRKR
jgi:2-polyprenyl-3-methyl-5-hydroxy-6-metoxy-1,4-benzoquinol methylase